MEGSCEYVEYAVTDSRQCVVIQPGGLAGGLTTLPRKTQYLLRITMHSLGTGRHNLSTGNGHEITGSGQRPVAGCCECGDEPSGSCAT
jgi:hypothetical protein